MTEPKEQQGSFKMFFSGENKPHPAPERLQKVIDSWKWVETETHILCGDCGAGVYDTASSKRGHLVISHRYNNDGTQRKV